MKFVKICNVGVTAASGSEDFISSANLFLPTSYSDYEIKERFSPLQQITAFMFEFLPLNFV